ncbi:MAG: hypothetical protein AAGA85_16215 [Bacteroidota bacterium]
MDVTFKPFGYSILFLEMWTFVLDHPLYIPFVLVNAWVIYKAIQDLAYKDAANDDSNDTGGDGPSDPSLDLPPGITLPSDKEPALVD